MTEGGALESGAQGPGLADLLSCRVGYGAMRLTDLTSARLVIDEQRASVLLNRAVDLGVQLFDTADIYGAGANEELLAKSLAPYPSHLVVATKGGMVQEGSNWVPRGSPDYLRRACKESLRRLRIDCIPLYQLHVPDPRVPFADSVGALHDLRHDGLVARVGLSNVTLHQFELARATTRIDSVQNGYHLRDRTAESLIQETRAHGVAFIPWFPLAGGALARAGVLLNRIARRHDATPAQVVLAWSLSRSSNVVVIPGTASLAHVEENVHAREIRLTAREVEILDRLSRLAPGE